MMKNRFDAVLMGGMKCGTTWLSQNMAASKEIKINTISQYNLLDSNELLIDKYFKNILRLNMKLEESLPETLFSINKNMKFVVLLRNPINRTYSHFIHYIKKEKRLNWNYYNGEYRPIDRLLSPKCVYRKSRNNYYFDINTDIEERKEDYINHIPGWIKKSFYYKLLNPFFTLFPKENFLLLKFEEIQDKPKKILKEVCAFLEIDPTSQMLEGSDKVINSSKHKNLRDLLLKKKFYFPEPNKYSHSFLRELFESDVRKLSSLTGEDFSSYWGL